MRSTRRKAEQDPGAGGAGGSARVGRPPAVSAQAIVAAAIELGLDTVTFKQIADRLGVAQATLYRHVPNRDELVRLAAFQLTLARRLPDSQHEHWSALAERYAESLFEAFVGEPQLIAELSRGRLGPHAEIDILEQFLDVLTREHGFSVEEGAVLFHSVGMLTVGAASAAIGLKASIQNGESWQQLVQRTLVERDERSLRLSRRVLGRVGESSLLIDWRSALRTMLAGYAAARGEALPLPDARRRH